MSRWQLADLAFISFHAPSWEPSQIMYMILWTCNNVVHIPTWIPMTMVVPHSTIYIYSIHVGFEVHALISNSEASQRTTHTFHIQKSWWNPSLCYGLHMSLCLCPKSGVSWANPRLASCLLHYLVLTSIIESIHMKGTQFIHTHIQYLGGFAMTNSHKKALGDISACLLSWNQVTSGGFT